MIASTGLLVEAIFIRLQGQADEQGQKCTEDSCWDCKEGIEMIEAGNKQIWMRIFLTETDQYRGRPAYQTIVELLHEEKISRATVIRGIIGFGASKRIHTASILRLSQDLPIIVEAVDTQENIDRVLPKIRPLVGQSLIIQAEVSVLKYTPTAVLEN